MSLRRLVVASAAVLALSTTALAYDDCDADFIAYLGSNAYQFSPLHEGDLGRVRLFSVLSFEGAAADRDYGRALWRLEVKGPAPSERVVLRARGVGRIESGGTLPVELTWDGRDEDGLVVPNGTYRYTYRARFLADSVATRRAVDVYESAGDVPGIVEAKASMRNLVVDDGLTPEAARGIRGSLAGTSCQARQNAPLEMGFPYNFYYGSNHSHSMWSDGGHPPAVPATSNCSSGNGNGTFTPADIYAYVVANAGLDYWVVNEHNHLLDDAMTVNTPPVTEAKIKQRYQDGRTAAAAVTVDDSFIGIYGMEWGVISNGGHITLLDTPVLFGWETCSTCTGATQECTTGTNCWFDVYTPKSNYPTLYARSVANPSPAGPLGNFCHPSYNDATGLVSDYGNLVFDANADAAVQGIAIRSGLAFSSQENCADGNVALRDYWPALKDALNKGFHVGPTADHDSHCNNYGVALPTRTVYLLPNGSAPVLTKNALLQAHAARHFFASEDSNAQLVFATQDGTHVMGDIFTVTDLTTLRAAVYDPTMGEGIATLEIWKGKAGTGVPLSPVYTVSAQSSLSFTDSASNGTYYYYVHAVQSDGHDLWSAPMWITYNVPTCGPDASLPAVTPPSDLAVTQSACE
jgi:hypothetical protein